MFSTHLNQHKRAWLLHYTMSMFHFLNCQLSSTVDCTILHWHQQPMGVPVASHEPHLHLVMSASWRILRQTQLQIMRNWGLLPSAIWVTQIRSASSSSSQLGVQWYVTVVWICISLMRYDVEHLSICWFAIYTSALGRHLLWEGVCSGEVSAQFASFLIRFFVFLLLSVKNFCAFWITVLFQTHLLSIFSAGLWLIFSFL